MEKYETAVYEEIGQYPRMYKVGIPFIDEDTRTSPLRAANSEGDFVECPSCLHTFSAEDAWSKHLHNAGTPRKLRNLMKPATMETVDRDVLVGDGPCDSDLESTCSGTSGVADGDSDTDWVDEYDDGDQWWSQIAVVQPSALRGAGKILSHPQPAGGVNLSLLARRQFRDLSSCNGLFR